MNQHKQNLAFVNMQSVLFQPCSDIRVLGVNHDAQASEHLNPTQQHTNNNPENSINESSNTSIKPSDNKIPQVRFNQIKQVTLLEAKLIQQTNNKPQFNKDSSVSKQPSNTHVRKKRASNSDEIEFNSSNRNS